MTVNIVSEQRILAGTIWNIRAFLCCGPDSRVRAWTVHKVLAGSGIRGYYARTEEI
jgi:hypothetical protein